MLFGTDDEIMIPFWENVCYTVGNALQRGVIVDILEAREEYLKARRLGQKEIKELSLQGKDTEPAVLDAILGENVAVTAQEIGVVNIPIERIVGTKTAGRVGAFSPGFMPVLGVETEFAQKWMHLCVAHLSDEGIRSPILCYEYLGNFYVQEGNKRLSVLKYFGASQIPGTVYRILPKESDEPHIKAYFEFLEFYKATGLYDIRFRHPGDYEKLMSSLGKDLSQMWTEREQRTFRAYFRYFKEAYQSLRGDKLDLLPEEALLLWLKVYPFRDLGEKSAEEIKQALSALWNDVVSISQEDPVQVETEADAPRGNLLNMLLTVPPSSLNVAFVYQLNPEISAWAKGHYKGAEYMYRVLSDRVSITHYFNADTPEEAEMLLEQAVLDGADVVFATTPKLSRPTLKMSVKYPRVRFLNCSVDAPYSSVRTYYGRVYEGKFITGAIAGAMANNDRIGYIGSYPILGVPASINAFALGAQLTNPRAKIALRWSCLGGDPVSDFIESGINVISNRDVPTADKKYLEFGTYGTYMVEDGILYPLGSPCWEWGHFYENVIRSILNGSWEKGRDNRHAVNYWWGMASGVIDVELADSLPEGLLHLSKLLREGLRNGTLDPFHRKLVAQDGRIINDGTRNLSPEELLHMDWLCENVNGSIPAFEEIAPFARDMVRELGVYRDSIPMEKEGSL